MGSQTYITLDVRVLNLCELTDEEYDLLMLCERERRTLSGTEFAKRYVWRGREPGFFDPRGWEKLAQRLHPLQGALVDMWMRREIEEGHIAIDLRSDAGDPFRDPATLRQPERERRPA